MKNLLKSLFISSYPLTAIVVLVMSIINFKFNLNVAGAILASLSVILFFALLFTIPRARTSKNLLIYTSIITISLVLNLTNIKSNEFYSTLILFIGWLLYLFWYSNFGNRNSNALKVGTKIGDYTFENTLKETINLHNIEGDYKILIFYRGNWCPLCMAQIKEIVNEYKELEKRKASVLLISSQPHSFTESLAKKHQVPFHFLTDLKNKVAMKLQIIDTNGLPFGFQLFGFESDIVMPTVIITDKNNNIIFADLTDNYRVRPEPSTFIKIIDQHT